MITNNTSINDLPPEILKYTLSFLEINDFGKASLISSSFEKIVKEVFCDGILNNNNTFYSRKNKDTGSFFHIVCRNYRRNAIENLIVSLFNHNIAPTICKLKMIYYAKSINKALLPQLEWKNNGIEDGLTPKNIKLSKLEKVPFDFISKIHVSNKNSFKTGELVAVFGSIESFHSSACYFGRICSYSRSENSWRVLFQEDVTQWPYSSYKTASEIGKFPSDCELPSFCSM